MSCQSLSFYLHFSGGGGVASAQTNQPPSAVAMALTGQDDGTVNGGRRVWLNAGGSTDPDNDSLTYSWRQTAGTTVMINPDPGGDADYSYFTAPGATSTEAALTFELTAHDGTATSTAEVSVVVRAAAGTRPTNVAATPVSGTSSQIEVTWTTVADAQTYWVQYKSGSEEYDGLLRNIEVTAPAASQILYGLNGSTQYTIRVIAINTAGRASQPSAAATATTSALPAGYEDPPGPVIRVWLFPETSLGPDGLQLLWYEPATDDADAYYVQWKSGTQDWDTSRQKLRLSESCHPTIGFCTLGITDLNAETEYTFRVAAVKGAYDGGTEQFTPSSDHGRPSPELVVTTLAWPMGATTVTTARSTYFEVTWDSFTGASHYYLQWKSGDQEFGHSSREIVVFATEDPTVSSVITGLTPETVYTLQVTAWTPRSGGGFDANKFIPVTATTAAVVAGEVEPPSRVLGLRNEPSGTTKNQIQIIWNSSPNADGYIVQWRSDDQLFSDTERRAVIACDADCQSSPTQSYLFTDLSIGTILHVRVIATRTGATINGTPSIAILVSTRLAQPGNLQTWVEAGTVGQLTVSWDEVPAAVAYRVQWVAAEESFDQDPPVYEEIYESAGLFSAKGDPPNRRFSTIIDTGNPGGVRYKLRVAGLNINGLPSEWAGPREFIIIPRDLPPDDARAPGKPRNLSLTTGNGWIQASWDPPDDLGHPPLQAYYVVYREAEARTSIWSANLSSTRYTIRGLTNGQEYVVGVLASNFPVILGPEAGPLSATPQATGPSEPPSEPQRPPTKPRNLSLVPGTAK